MDEQSAFSDQACESRLRTLAPDVPGIIDVERMASRARHIVVDSPRRRARSRQVVASALASIAVVATVAVLADSLHYPDTGGDRAKTTGTARNEPFKRERVAEGSPTFASAQRSLTAPHTIISDVLDSDQPPGVSLSEALSRLGWTPSLPDEALVGKPVRVVVDDLGKDDPKTFGILIKYDSGIKLFTEYGETDFQAAMERTGSRPAGVARPALEIIAGRLTVVSQGGGVFPRVVSWNLRGYTYSLRSLAPSIDMQRLKNVGTSIH